MFREDEDFYIKINDGDVVTENKTTDIDFINETIETSEETNMPHYNSPEYAEYISKMNRDSLKEITSEDINNVNPGSKIGKEIKEKYPKKTIQLCLLGAIVILFVAIIFNTKSMMGSISNSGMVTNQSIGQGDTNEFKFLTDVVVASAKDSIDSYNILEDISMNKMTMGNAKYKEAVLSVKENAKTNLADVNSLSSYIKVENFSEIVSALTTRYENLIKLCDELLGVGGLNPISTYNKYALEETKTVDALNNALINKAKSLGIDYKVEDESIVLYID